MGRPVTAIALGLLAAVALSNSCRLKAAPDQLFAEAEGLRRKYEKEASQQAIVKYREAVTGWTRLNNTRQATIASQKIGATFEQLGMLHESLESYRAALLLAEASSDRLLESEVHSDVGVARSLAAAPGEDEGEALHDCESALTTARQLHGVRQEAKALNCLGEVAYNEGERERALGFYVQAQNLWDQLRDPQGQAETLLFQGYVYSDQSQLDRAQTCFDRAMSLWTSLADSRGKAVALVAEARLRQRRGEYQEALNRFQRAQELLQRMGDAVWEAASLTGLGTVYLKMGQTEYALKYWERAFELFEAAGLKIYSVDVLMSLGDTYLAAGDDTSAFSRFERALALGTELGNPHWQAYALRFIGVIYLVRDEPTEAIQYLQRSLEVQRHFIDPRFEAQTRADVGEARELLGDHDAARRSFAEALDLGRAAVDRVAESRALYGLARASIGLGDLSSARTYIEQSLSVVESIRTEVESRDLRASYVASVHQYHELRMDVLMRLHDRRGDAGLAAAAFEASERARARSLLDSLADARVNLRAGLDPDLLDREQTIKQAFDEWAGRRATATSQSEVAALAAEYRDLEATYQQIEAEIRSKSPRYAALAQPEPLSLREVQQQVLDPDTLLLEYALGEERSYLWAVTERGQSSYTLPPRGEVEHAAQRLYEKLTTRLSATGDLRARQGAIEGADREYRAEAARLSETLLGPVARQLPGKRILVVADGALQYVPFAALPVPGHGDGFVPLMAEHEVVHLPSASVLGVIRRETADRPVAAGTVAVLADPVFEQDDPRLQGRGVEPAAPTRDASLDMPRLPATRQEADAICALAPAGTTLEKTGLAASRATAQSRELAGYRIVHFATHGILDNETPGLSGLMLSTYDAQGRPQDGLLRLHDIYALRLPVELVVLSACNTALGRQLRGEGLVGVVRGFMYAGAKRVVASLWKVDDEATGELMTRFYRHMLGEGLAPAAALRAAQVEMWQQARWQSPYYWAAFQLQGEWQAPETGRPHDEPTPPDRLDRGSLGWPSGLPRPGSPPEDGAGPRPRR
jgi:CHAT domain-containing protein